MLAPLCASECEGDWDVWSIIMRLRRAVIAGVQLYQDKNLMKKKNILSVSLTLRDSQRNNLRGLSLWW